MNIKVLTDSSNDMQAEDLKRLDIEVLPLYVTEGDIVYRDGIDIHPGELYENMRNGKDYKTSQIAYGDFEKRFTELAEEQIPFIFLSFSAGLSGTYQTAVLAKEEVKKQFPEAEIEIINTKAVTGGLALIVEQVAEAAQKGVDMAELVTLSEDLSSRIRHVYTVTDLNYLYRGGRLSKGSATVGNMLQIKPLLDMNKAGELKQVDKARGEKKLLKKMVQYIVDNGSNLDQQTIYITHADNRPLVDEFIAIAQKTFGMKNYKIHDLAPVIATHSGPGTLAVFFFE